MATFRSYKQESTVEGIYNGSLTGETYNRVFSSSSNSQIAKEMQARGIYDRVESRWDTAFSRVGIVDPYNATTSTFEYIFFTKPDLHLMEGGSANPELTNRSSYFADTIDRYPHIVDQLQFSYSMGRNGGALSPLLSNAVSGVLELPSVSAKTIDTPQNSMGTKIEYRGSSYESDEGFDFSIDFKDTKYLEVYQWFKMYDEYEKMKWRGQVSPTLASYIPNKILHDQMAIYKIITAEDGMSIIFWARIMGCFPTSVPRDAFSSKVEGELTYSTSWHGQFVSDMDPAILTDLNNIVTPYRGSNYSYIPLYDSNYHRFNPSWARCPVIRRRTSNTTTQDKLNRYYLMWA